MGITAAYLLTAPSQQLAACPRPRRPMRREAAGRSCPRPWPRRRPSGTLRTRTTAASCGFFYPKMTRRGRRPAAGSPLWPTRGWTSLACQRTPGGWRSSSSCGSRPCGRMGWSTASSSSAPRAARHREAQCYREIVERTRKAPAQEEPLRYKGKASAELAPDVLRGPRGLQHARPTVHIAQQQPASPGSPAAAEGFDFFLVCSFNP